MLITFKTRASRPDITLFGDIALKLIALMDRREEVPGIIEPQDIPRALQSLRKGVVVADTAAEDGDMEDVDAECEQTVSIHNRAIPLIELLEAAHKANVPVMWEEGGRSY